MRKVNAGWILLAVVSALLFALLAAAVQQQEGPAGNGWAQKVMDVDRSGDPAGWIAVFDWLGSTTAFAVVALAGAAALWLCGRRRASLGLVAAVLSSYLLNTLLKSLFARERPLLDRVWAEADGYGFPSGNAMVGMALYGMLTYAAMTGTRSAAGKAGWLVFGLTVVGLLGYARLYFGVHYYTDIAAGYCGGLFCIACLAWTVRSK